MIQRILGVTGGVGAGKSAVLNILKENYQAYVIEADAVGRRLEKRGQPGYEAVVKEFGEKILGADGEIDRGKLAALVFSDADALQRLNSLLHPMIYEEIQAEILRESKITVPETSGKKQSFGTDILERKTEEQVRLFVIEAAILFETGFDRCCDDTLYVRADEETRIARLRDTRGYSREKAMSVIANQLSDEEFMARADFVVENSGNLEETKRQICDLMKNIILKPV